MTTLAYRDGVLAADRRVTHDGTICAELHKKIRRTKDGRLLGFIGDLGSGASFVKWASKPNGPPPKGDYSGIIVLNTGTVLVFEQGNPLPPSKPKFLAWGSGMDGALGALHMGADAKTAVKIAQKIDPSSGGGVDVITI